ncbi:MAG TPA: hypothetical protein VHX49_00315 [Candidatus Acidoferrales bacterium]|nr:hypothetical protein [Candidatus Acidoferrales bacterium]
MLNSITSLLAEASGMNKSWFASTARKSASLSPVTLRSNWEPETGTSVTVPVP